MKATKRCYRPLFSALRGAIAILCAMLLVPGDSAVYAQQAGSNTAGESTRLSNDQLDSLVAPIALYPDPLLAQVLAASTYPLEIVTSPLIQLYLDTVAKYEHD